MKEIAVVIFFLVNILACNQKSTAPQFYGQQFDTTQSISVSELSQQMQDRPTLEAVVSGKVTSSCKAEGCWMNLENPGGEEIYVDWDHQFNIPLEAEGKIATIKGYAYYDSTGNVKKLAFKASGAWL